MKYLYIIRHAKAEPFKSNQEDHERQLIEQGKKRAEKLGKWLLNASPGIEQIFCSSSNRTCQTAEIINTEFLDKVPVNINSELYGATEEILLNFLVNINDEINSIGLIGHQPGIKNLAIYLTGGYSKGLENSLNVNFSTSSALILLLNIKRWDQISERIGILSNYYNSLKA